MQPSSSQSVLFAGLSGPPTSAPASAPSNLQRTVYDKEGLSILFAFSKPAGQPSVTDIAATATFSGSGNVAGFVLQVNPLAS